MRSLEEVEKDFTEFITKEKLIKYFNILCSKNSISCYKLSKTSGVDIHTIIDLKDNKNDPLSYTYNKIILALIKLIKNDDKSLSYEILRLLLTKYNLSVDCLSKLTCLNLSKVKKALRNERLDLKMKLKYVFVLLDFLKETLMKKTL